MEALSLSLSEVLSLSEALSEAEAEAEAEVQSQARSGPRALTSYDHSTLRQVRIRGRRLVRLVRLRRVFRDESN
jgi:hypothetical protein